jgi:hypothetical protein
MENKQYLGIKLLLILSVIAIVSIIALINLNTV